MNAHHDAVILAQRLPDGDGFELLQQWRTAWYNELLPILNGQTPGDAVKHRIAGLDLGADDYPEVATVGDR